MAVKLTVSHEYSGLSDYWGGNGRRWDNDAGCAFAFYGAGTTLRECVDQWVDDVWQGGDFEHNGDGRDPWEEVTEDDVRAAILDSLTEQGLADYHSGAVAECAAEYAAINDLDEDEDEDDCMESPIWVILIEVEQCSECGAGDEHVIDDICKDCADKHGYDLTV